jgi:hypothetical protein
VPRSCWPGMPWCRTFGADTTSWRLTGPPAGEWRSHSTNWSWRSDPSRGWPSACPGSAQRNSACRNLTWPPGAPDLDLVLLALAGPGDRPGMRLRSLAGYQPRPAPRFMAPSGSGAAAAGGALRAIDSPAGPRSWRSDRGDQGHTGRGHHRSGAGVPGGAGGTAASAWHGTDRYANNRVECDHGRLKARLQPMRGVQAGP